MGTSGYYSYFVEEFGNAQQSYIFRTGQHANYSVTIDPCQYVEYINQYPALLTNGSGISFFKLADRKTSRDLKIRNTIIKIASEYMKSAGDESVLLYHCEHSDGRQYARSYTFKDWYKCFDGNDKFVHESLKIEDNNNGTVYYMGYFTAAHNPNLAQIQSEFASLSSALLLGK